MVKSIIKRIIVGVGIALCLMAIKDGGLIGQVYAMSCDTNYENHFFPYSGIYENTWTDNTLNNPVWTGQNFTGYNIPFKPGYDYLEISVPALFTINSESNTSPSYTIDLVSSGSAWAVLNNTTSGVTNWQRGYYKNGRFYTRYYYQDYPNQSNLTITGFRMAAPTFLGNFSSIYVYMRVEEMWFVSYYKCDGNEALQQSIEENTQAVDSVNDSLQDQSDANTSGFLQDIQQDYSNNPVSDLITMPITFLQRLNNNVSGSCITWNLGSLLGTNLTMPCINLQNILGSWLYNLIDMAICLFLAYNIGLMCVTIWNNMTSLKDDFDDMYSPRHAYNGKHTGGDS